MQSSISLSQITQQKQGAFWLLISAHVAGFIGLQIPFTRPLFEALVPFNLIFTALLLGIFHRDWNAEFINFSLITMLVGFFMEVLGVHTELIFGTYFYGETLGFKLFSVPLLIALNWWILVYVAGTLTTHLNYSLFIKSCIGAALMVFLDFWIEPVAIQHDFWSWENNHIPLHNYLGWFVISCFLVYLFHLSNFQKNNFLAKPTYTAQLLFFFFHNVTYWFYL